jgi:hypothetical protein
MKKACDQFATNSVKSRPTCSNEHQRLILRFQRLTLMAKNLHDQLILPLKLVRLPVPPRPPRREETIIGAFQRRVNIRAAIDVSAMSAVQ